MNETELFARIGRQAIAIEQKEAGFDQLLNIFGDVLEGKTDPRRILINRTERRFEMAPDGFAAASPATINGFPVCAVYAPFNFPPEPVSDDPNSPDYPGDTKAEAEPVTGDKFDSGGHKIFEAPGE